MVGAGDKDEVVAMLNWRIVAVEAEIAASQAVLEGTLSHGIPRIFVIEEEYGQAMRRAELAFVRQLIADLQEGGLWPDAALLEALVERERARGGGTV
jgi:hypothetical protein